MVLLCINYREDQLHGDQAHGVCLEKRGVFKSSLVVSHLGLIDTLCQHGDCCADMFTICKVSTYERRVTVDPSSQ